MDHNPQIQVELQEFMGTDRSIAEAAWTSSLDYQRKQLRTNDDVERVVRMLAQNQHATPFESVIFKFWIKMPIQTDRQHMTHRIASHNGMSGRYRTMPNEWLKPPDDIFNIMQRVNPSKTMQEYEDLCAIANKWYIDLLDELKLKEKQGLLLNKEYKRCREFFRGILPQNNMTERVSIFNLRSFANYQYLRNSDHAQPEIRQIAQLMHKAIQNAQNCPIALSALERQGWRI